MMSKSVISGDNEHKQVKNKWSDYRVKNEFKPIKRTLRFQNTKFGSRKCSKSPQNTNPLYNQLSKSKTITNLLRSRKSVKGFNLKLDALNPSKHALEFFSPQSKFKSIKIDSLNPKESKAENPKRNRQNKATKVIEYISEMDESYGGKNYNDDSIVSMQSDQVNLHQYLSIFLEQ